MKPQTKVIIIVIAVMLIFRMVYPQILGTSEGFDCESCQTLSSLYSKKEIVSDSLQITKDGQIGGNVNIKGNTTIGGDATVKGTITGDLKIKNQLNVGDWSIYQDKNGDLQFEKSGNKTMTLPSDRKHPPVFRATGLVYQNDAFRKSKNWRDNHPIVNRALKMEPDNSVYLGGANSDDNNHKLLFATHRGSPDNDVISINLHGVSRVCSTASGNCDK